MKPLAERLRIISHRNGFRVQVEMRGWFVERWRTIYRMCEEADAQKRNFLTITEAREFVDKCCSLSPEFLKACTGLYVAGKSLEIALRFP